jgi:hypothetical protein
LILNNYQELTFPTQIFRERIFTGFGTGLFQLGSFGWQRLKRDAGVFLGASDDLERAVLYAHIGSRVFVLHVYFSTSRGLSDMAHLRDEALQPQAAGVGKDEWPARLRGFMLDLAAHIVEQKRAKFQPEKFEDRYEDALKDLIAKKQKGMKIERPKERAPFNVVNLMEALRASVQSERRSEAPRKSARPSPRVAQKAGPFQRASEEGRLALLRVSAIYVLNNT